MSILKRLQLLRGTQSQIDSFIGIDGEPTWNNEKKRLSVHDGATPGGIPQAAETQLIASGTGVDAMSSDYANWTYDPTLLQPVANVFTLQPGHYILDLGNVPTAYLNPIVAVNGDHTAALGAGTYKPAIVIATNKTSVIAGDNFQRQDLSNLTTYVLPLFDASFFATPATTLYFAGSLSLAGRFYLTEETQVTVQFADLSATVVDDINLSGAQFNLYGPAQ